MTRRPNAGRRSRSDAAWARSGRGRATRARGRPAPTEPIDTSPTGTAPTDPAPIDPAPRGTSADPPPTASDRRGSGPATGRPAGRARGRAARPRPDTCFRRRRLAAGLAAVVVLLVGVGLGTRMLLYDAGLADVTGVAVTGLATVPEPAVRDAAAVPLGVPLVSVDTAGVAERVAALPGVAAVAVRRAWPHTVEVAVTERVPVALWPTPQALLEVDGTGLPYRPAPDPPPALPRLAFSGVGPQDPATAAALAVLRELPPPLRTQVSGVEVAGTTVTLGLADGRSVRWGDPDRAADKVAVLGPLLGQPGTVYDVSSPDLPTVRP